MSRIFVFLASWAFLVASCAPVAPGSLRPTAYATGTQPVVVLASTKTTTPTATGTPVLAIVRCVVAEQALWLRVSASEKAAPILAIRSGAEVTVLIPGAWSFVRVGTNTGWVNSDYLGECK